MTDDLGSLVTQSRLGDKTCADRLVERVHRELQGLANKYFRDERAGHTLQPTALVNEAYLRLVRHHNLDSKSTTHFFALAAKEMRRVLVDHARARGAAKRGGGWQRVPLELGALQTSGAVEVNHIAELLGKLAELDPRTARVAELRLFAGLGEEEIAEAVGIAPRTAREDWRVAKAWLQSELGDANDS